MLLHPFFRGIIVKKRFWLFLILTIVIMGVIFYLSAQNATESSDMSMGFIRRFLHKRLIEVMSVESAEMIEKGIETIVRKSAHFFIYTCLGFCSAMTLYYSEKVNKGCILFILSLAFCIFYASTDEVHQLFVQGRSGEVRDVLIDSAGSTTGILLSMFVCKIASVLKKKLSILFIKAH